MRIGEVAERAGVSVRALRYYEEQGLVVAGRTAGGQREYPGSVVDRVRFIQDLYAAGLPSKAVLSILPCMDTGTATPEMIRRMAEEQARIQARIDDLSRARDRLADLIHRAADCSAGAPADGTASLT